MHGFSELEARALLGAQVRPREELAPAAWCGQVVGAELVGAGWEVLIRGELRGNQVLTHCSREDFIRFLVGPWVPC